MKIVHIHQYYNDNCGYHENILPQYHANLGHEVTLITSNYSNGYNETREQNVGVYQVGSVNIVRLPIFGEFKNRFVIFENLYSQLLKEKPDYIYHHSATSPSLGIVSKYVKKNPLVFLVVDNHADLNICGRNKIWKYIYYNLLWKNYLKLYDSRIKIYFGVTPNRCGFLIDELGVSNHKTKLLPIGILDNNIPIKCKIMDRFDKNEILIVHGGKMSKEKKTDTLINSFKNIKNNDLRLVLFGSFLDKEISELIEDDNRIIYLGWLNREEILEVLAFSHFGVWHSQHTTLIEDAIGSNLPIIIRYYGSTSHLIKENGIYLFEGSQKELENSIRFLSKNPQLLKKMREKSDYIKDILSYKSIAKESIEYFNSNESGRIHTEFMSSEYNDFSYSNFKKFK